MRCVQAADQTVGLVEEYEMVVERLARDGARKRRSIGVAEAVIGEAMLREHRVQLVNAG